MFQAPLFVVALALIGAWRQVGIDRKIPLWAQYYTPLYTVAAVFMAETMWQTHRVLKPTEWLDEETTRMVILNETGVILNVTSWEAETSLDQFRPLLYFSLSMPVWVSGTFLVCLVHTLLHVAECRSGDLSCHPQ